MKTYTILFIDKDFNDHYKKTLQFYNIKDAKEYAKKFLANLCDNDVIDFIILAY